MTNKKSLEDFNKLKKESVKTFFLKHCQIKNDDEIMLNLNGLFSFSNNQIHLFDLYKNEINENLNKFSEFEQKVIIELGEILRKNKITSIDSYNGTNYPYLNIESGVDGENPLTLKYLDGIENLITKEEILKLGQLYYVKFGKTFENSSVFQFNEFFLSPNSSPSIEYGTGKKDKVYLLERVKILENLKSKLISTDFYEYKNFRLNGNSQFLKIEKLVILDKLFSDFENFHGNNSIINSNLIVKERQVSNFFHVISKRYLSDKDLLIRSKGYYQKNYHECEINNLKNLEIFKKYLEKNENKNFFYQKLEDLILEEFGKAGNEGFKLGLLGNENQGNPSQFFYNLQIEICITPINKNQLNLFLIKKLLILMKNKTNFIYYSNYFIPLLFPEFKDLTEYEKTCIFGNFISYLFFFDN